jgi:DNA-binding MarR family transcriptional regulator
MSERAILAFRLALGSDLQRASRRWRQLITRGLKRYGYGDLRPSFAPVLLPLCDQDGLPIGELGRRTGLSKQAMTEAIRLMEKRQLVRTCRDEQDSRIVRVYLAPRGKAFPLVAKEVLAEIEHLLQSHLGDAGLDAARQALQALAALGNDERM